MQNKWEIWLAKVKFEDDVSVVKQRLVLVISETDAYILSLKMTGAAPREDYPGEYKVLQWKKAGLTKPTTIRTSKKLKLFQKLKISQIKAVTKTVEFYSLQRVGGCCEPIACFFKTYHF